MKSPHSKSNGVPIMLALSSLLGAAGFVLSGTGAPYLALGAGGIAAVGLSWSAQAATPLRARARGAAVALVIFAGSLAALWLSVGVALATDEGIPILEALRLGGADDGVTQTSYEVPPHTAVAWAGMLLGVAVCGLLGPTARRMAIERDASARRTRTRRFAVAAPFALIAGTASIDGAYSGAIAALLGAWWLLRTLRPDVEQPRAPEPAAAPA